MIRTQYRRLIHRQNHVLHPKPALRGRRTGDHLVHLAARLGKDAGKNTQAQRIVGFERDGQIAARAVTHHTEGRRAGAARQLPLHLKVGPRRHLAPVDAVDAVAGTQPRRPSRRLLRHHTDARIHRAGPHAWHPSDQESQRHRQHHIAERPRYRDNDPPPRRNVGQFARRRTAAALHLFHAGRVKLRQRHIPAERNAADLILHAIDGAFPERRPETDRKGIHLQTQPARGQKMAELVDKNRQAEQQDHAHTRQDRQHKFHDTPPLFSGPDP